MGGTLVLTFPCRHYVVMYCRCFLLMVVVSIVSPGKKYMGWVDRRLPPCSAAFFKLAVLDVHFQARNTAGCTFNLQY